MGTRNVICLYSGGQYRVAQYAQWDGYPSGQGNGILEQLRRNGPEALRAGAARTKFATQEDLDAAQAKFDAYSEENPGDHTPVRTLYPAFSRDLGSDILGVVVNTNPNDTLLLRDELKFIADGLMCEWAYVVDLDSGVLEVYKGFNRTPLQPEDRFYGLRQHARGGYQPAKLVKSWPLAQLPDSMDGLERELSPEDEDEQEDA